jgi:pilus biogenesis lipoprotein CpaD
MKLFMSSFAGSHQYKKLVCLVPSLFLSGCLLERDPYIERDWAPKIDIDSRSHLLNYKTGKSSLTNQDKATIKRLYHEFDHLDQIMVRIGIDHQPAFARSTKNKARVDSIRRYLINLGVNSSQIQVVDKNKMRGNDIDSERSGIIVSFQKSTITPPKCPGWDYRMDGNVPPEGEPDFGCNTARNTAIMAADPNVLIQAEEFGGSDGARSAISVQELRTDKVKKLKIEQVKNQNGN